MMRHDADIIAIPSTTAPTTPSAAAERMSRHRERRRDALRCLTIEVRETEIDTLVGMKLLRAEMRNPSAISKALCAYFDRTLDPNARRAMRSSAYRPHYVAPGLRNFVVRLVLR